MVLGLKLEIIMSSVLISCLKVFVLFGWCRLSVMDRLLWLQFWKYGVLCRLLLGKIQ